MSIKRRKKIGKKTKGIRYVAKVLNKYFKRKYPNYTSALPKAREITQQFNESGTKFTVRNIFSVVRKPQVNKFQRNAPLLFYKLRQVIPYYELVDYSTYIFDNTNEVFFKSELFNQEVDMIQGGQRPSYRKTFSGFVNFMNKTFSKNGISSSDEVDCYVTTLPPKYDKEQKIWISEIITTTENGEPTDFGYESQPTDPSILSKSYTSKGKNQKTTKSTKSAPKDLKTEKILLIEAEAERIKQENLQSVMKLYQNKEINQETFEIIIKNLNK